MSGVRVHIFISGRVQGILFRERMRRKAQKFGVRGFVKNLPDRRVEAVLEGEKEKVEKLIQWVKKGPFLAEVDGIELKWEEHQEGFNDFKIRY